MIPLRLVHRAAPALDPEVISDLTTDEATQITSCIRTWVKACPIEDIKRAYFGRVWLAMGYESWAEWRDCELGGFTLPAIERREVVAELAGSGMSNVAIGEVLNVDEGTVRNDRRKTGSENSEVNRKVTGKDNREIDTSNIGKTPRKNPNDMEPVFQSEFGLSELESSEPFLIGIPNEKDEYAISLLGEIRSWLPDMTLHGLSELSRVAVAFVGAVECEFDCRPDDEDG